MRNKLLLAVLAVLLLTLAACGKAAPAAAGSTAGEAAPALLGSAPADEYAEYAGYQFSGADPWDGQLTVTILDITDGKMAWSFVDSFENHTLYQVQKQTPVQAGKAEFDIQGADVEQGSLSFSYQGSLELKDGRLTLSFRSGAVTDAAAEGDSSVRIADSLTAPENQAVLDKLPEGPYTVYTVQSGDSVHSIAEAHGISTKALCILNQVVIIETAKAHGYEFDDVTAYAAYLFPGEELLVPKP